MLNFYIVKNHFLRKHVNLVKNLIEVLKTGNFDNFFEPCNFSKKSIFRMLNWNFLIKFFLIRYFECWGILFKKIQNFSQKVSSAFEFWTFLTRKTCRGYISVQIKNWTSRNSSFCPSMHALKLFQLPLFKKTFGLWKKT